MKTSEIFLESYGTRRLMLAVLLASTLILATFFLIALPEVLAGTPGFVKPLPFGPGDSLTSAIAVGDMDGDGDMDIIAGNEDGNYLYLNAGRGDFSTEQAFGDPNDDVLALAVGDSDADGALDVAVIRANNTGVVYLNDGTGDFTEAISFGSATYGMTSVAMGDVDGDGYFDLVCSTAAGADRIFHNNAGNSFTLSASLAVNASSSAALADLDDDGWLDIIIGSINGPNRLYINDQTGAFDLLDTFGNGQDASLAFADFDGDQSMDIVVGNNDDSTEVYLNDGAGTFTLGATLNITAAQTTSVVAADMDGDGDVDVVVGNNLEPNQVYFNDGTGEFPLSRTFGPGSDSAQAVSAGDFDGDGALDIAVGTSVEQNMIYLNDGGGGFPTVLPFGTDTNVTRSVAVGDLTGDGYLDLVLGDAGSGLLVYEGDGMGEFSTGFSAGAGAISTVVLGDMDGDHDLDLIAGNLGAIGRVYRNDGSGNFSAGATFGATGDTTQAIVVGDLDGDTDLDVVAGYQSGFNRIYLNTGAGAFAAARPFGIGEEWTFSLALGDLDNDGDLDIVAGNYNEQNAVYLNDGNGNFTTRLPFGPEDDWTRSVAVGDLNADGVLDVIVGNEGQQNFVYFNDGAAGFTISRPFGPGADWTYAVAVADLDADSDLDIVVGNNGEQNAVYLNDGVGLFNWTTPAATFGEATENTLSVAIGDMDDDGLPDIVAGNMDEQNAVYLNNIRWPKWLVNTPPTVRMGYPGLTAEGAFYTSAEILSGDIDIAYYLYDGESDPVGYVRAFFSPDGGGKWYPAVAAGGVITQDLEASPWPTGTLQVYTWDVNASGFFGRSDNVVFRIVAYPDFAPVENGVPGPYQWPYAAATTYPFRVRGNQIRVMQGAQPMAEAQVFHFQDGALRAAPYANNAGQPYFTDAQGYLQGRGDLHLGDRLVAIAPIRATDTYTLYYSSGVPTASGLDAHTVTALGVQTLNVASNHPLLLFNLDLSLEWDARNDGTFLTDLNEAIQRASEVLYDVSDGQIAIGEIRVHQERAQWISSDVVMYAQNGIRPRASMGGVTSELRDDVGVSGVITNAYGPGQIRMGPNWDPFGQSLAELSSDWQRAFAHELAHYLLYLPDNYIGVQDGLPISTDCRGSFMTSTYDDAYSEFLTRTGWVGECLDTVAAHLLNRTDWETVRAFYGDLVQPVALNVGPSLLPLEVARVRVQAPLTPATTLPPTFFDLRKATGELLAVPRAQGYLFQTQGTSALTDDSVVALGATVGGGDRVKVRGAAPGDRLCVFGPYNETTNVATMGCLPALQAGQRSVPVATVSNWQPLIVVNAVTSETWAITVTLKTSVSGLNVQVYPAYGAADGSAGTAPWAAMTVKPGNPLVYTRQMTLNDPAFEGFVRVWVPGQEGQREALTQIFLSPPWGPNTGGGGLNADMRAWGANSRQLGAPVASGDGR